MKKFLILFFAMALTIAVSANERGNGGDAVVCRNSDGSIRTNELLDFYEARTMRGISSVLLSDDLTYEENLEILLTHLEMVSPSRAKLYRTWLKDYESEVSRLRNIELNDIADSNHLVYPRGCKVEQLIIQLRPEKLGDKRFILNQDLWEELRSTSQAGLIMHELIYREVIETNARKERPGEINSIKVRHFNSLIAAGLLKGLSIKELNELMVSLEDFEFLEINGLDHLVYKETNINYSPDGTKILSAELKLGNIFSATRDYEISYFGEKYFIPHSGEYFLTTEMRLINGKISFELSRFYRKTPERHEFLRDYLEATALISFFSFDPKSKEMMTRGYNQSFDLNTSELFGWDNPEGCQEYKFNNHYYTIYTKDQKVERIEVHDPRWSSGLALWACGTYYSMNGKNTVTINF